MTKKLSVSTIWYRACRTSLIRAFGGKCWGCKKKLTRKSAQFAHTQPTGLDGGGRGAWKRLHDVMANPTCYALLCAPCHEEFDRAGNEWKGQKNGS